MLFSMYAFSRAYVRLRKLNTRCRTWCEPDNACGFRLRCITGACASSKFSIPMHVTTFSHDSDRTALMVIHEVETLYEFCLPACSALLERRCASSEI